jgi:transposase
MNGVVGNPARGDGNTGNQVIAAIGRNLPLVLSNQPELSQLAEVFLQGENPADTCHLDAALPNILEDGSTALSGALRFLLVELKRELEQLASHIEQTETLIQRVAQQNEACQRLDDIPGIGPLTATALIAAIGNGEAFRKGREFAAWLGLAPREHSTGGKQKLLGISKRGNCYLRKLFVQGARAVLQFREKQCSGLRHWLAELSSRSHYNVVGVALANKLARMAWTVLARGDAYRPPVQADMTGLQMAAV